MNDETITQSIQQAIAIIIRGRELERMLVEAGFTIADVGVVHHPKSSNGAASEPTKADSTTNQAQVQKAPEWPMANDDGELIDARGMLWDERIHASSRNCNDDGSWRRKRGVDPKLVERLENDAMDAKKSVVQAELTGTTQNPGPAEMTFDDIRDGMYRSTTVSEIGSWWEKSKRIVISASQRAVLDVLSREIITKIGAGDGSGMDKQHASNTGYHIINQTGVTTEESDLIQQDRPVATKTEDETADAINRLRGSIMVAETSDEVDELLGYASKNLVMRQGQKFALEASADERKRQLSDEDRQGQ